MVDDMGSGGTINLLKYVDNSRGCTCLHMLLFIHIVKGQVKPL